MYKYIFIFVINQSHIINLFDFVPLWFVGLLTINFKSSIIMDYY